MFYYGYDPTYILVIIGFLITLIAQIFVNSSYKKYKKVSVKSGLKGFGYDHTLSLVISSFMELI